MRFRLVSRAACCVLLCIVNACGTVTPTPAGGSPTASPTAAGDQVAGPTALEACDPAGLISCDQQAAFISIPIADSGLSLTWSSQWSPARSDHPDWNADSLGLGGWSIDVLRARRSSWQGPARRRWLVAIRRPGRPAIRRAGDPQLRRLRRVPVRCRGARDEAGRWATWNDAPELRLRPIWPVGERRWGR